MPTGDRLTSAKYDCVADTPLSSESAIDRGLSQAVKLCHGLAVDAGWWAEFNLMSASGQKSFLGTKIALIHSEVSEMLEGLRKGKADDHLPHRTAEEVEAADVFIRLADYCGKRDIDLASAVLEKLAYNQQRADHKPEERAKPGGKVF